MEKEQELRQTTHEWNKAIQNNDINGIAKYMSDDWIIVGTEGGIISRSDFLGWVESKALQHTKMAFDVVHIKVYNDCAVVVSKGISAGTWGGKEFQFHEWASDTYIRKKGKWLCALTMITPAKQE